MSDYDKVLRKHIKAMGLCHDDKLIADLLSYGEQILFWNRIAGITSHRNMFEIIEYMFLDSLAAHFLRVHFEDKSVCDFGSGGGFPGIPLKLVIPQMNMTLLDSSRKKCDFLEKVVTYFNLSAIWVVCARETHVRFDTIISRACAETSRLLDWTLPLLKKDGVLIFWKGPAWVEECGEPVLASHGVRLEAHYDYELPSEKRKRTLVVLKRK